MVHLSSAQSELNMTQISAGAVTIRSSHAAQPVNLATRLNGNASPIDARIAPIVDRGWIGEDLPQFVSLTLRGPQISTALTGPNSPTIMKQQYLTTRDLVSRPERGRELALSS